MKKQKQAFTLVELIVTISILSILGIISFLSFTSYLVVVRDSIRVVELENLSSSLSKYVLKSGYFPIPIDGIDITYSGGLVWTQGVFDNKISNIIGYSNDVLDPLTKSKYTYSVKNTKREFSIVGVLEEDLGLVYDNGLVFDSYAIENGTKKGTAMVNGNYNGELLIVKANNTNYILALPSIVSSDLNSSNLVDILDNNKLVYNNLENLPASYIGTDYKLEANLDISANDLIVFSGSLSKLKKSYNQIILLQNLFKAYSGSILGKKITTNKIDSVELFSGEFSKEMKNIACDIINFKLKYFVECGSLDFITFYVINILNIDITNLPGKLKVVYEGQNGIYSFGTDKGLIFYDSINNKWQEYQPADGELLDKKITALNQDNNGTYWIGTKKGLNSLNLGTDFFSTSDDSWGSYYPEGVIGNDIKSISIGVDGTIWIGTKDGSGSFDGDLWTEYSKIKSGNGKDYIEVRFIYTDSQNNVWFGFHGGGLDKYNVDTKITTEYTEDDSPSTIPININHFIFEDSNNNIWVGFHAKNNDPGLVVTSDYGDSWDSAITVNTLKLEKSVVQYIYEDLSGKIWIGTDSGLSRYSGNNNESSRSNSTNWKSYSKDKATDVIGLEDNKIISIHEDESGNIIVFTKGGLNTIDSNGNIITNIE